MIPATEDLRAAGLRASPVTIAVVLNTMVAVLVLLTITLQLHSRYHQVRASIHETAVVAAREQAVSISDQFKTIESVLGQLTIRLNENTVLNNADENALHETLRQFQNLLPEARDLLLVRDDGTLLAASNVMEQRMGMAQYCPEMAEHRQRTDADAMWVLSNSPVAARCPASGTVVVTHRSNSLQRLHGASVWLLLDNDTLVHKLADSLPAGLPASQFRLWSDAGYPLAEGTHLPPGRKPVAFPIPLNAPQAIASTERLDWSDAETSATMSAVSIAVTGLPLQVQVIYPAADAMLPQLRPSVINALLGASLFIALWSTVAIFTTRMIRRYQTALRQNEERFQRSLDYSLVGVWEWDLVSGRVYWSRQMSDLFALRQPISDLLPDGYLARIHPQDRERVKTAFSECVEHGSHVDLEHRIVREDGQVRWVHCFGKAERSGQGPALRLFGVMQDATVRLEAARKLAESAQQTQAILDNVVDAIITIDSTGTISSFNHAACQIFGYTLDEALGKNVKILMPEPYRHEHDGYIAAHEATGEKKIIGIGREVVGQHKDGRQFPINLAVSKVLRDGKPLYIGLVRDITRQREAEARIQNLAFFDQLTGLPNRRLLLDRLSHALRLGERKGQIGAVVVLDLDGFKTLNDSWGHEAGDQLLKAMGQRLTAVVRESDTVARLAGDEFVVLLENLGKDKTAAAAQAEIFAQNMFLQFATPIPLVGRSYYSAMSAGITLFGNEQGTTAEQALGQADMALNQAREHGCNCYRFFDAELQQSLSAKTALLHDLKLGLPRQQFLLHYQPQVDQEGRVTGFEALLRWSHPERGPVSPAEFIPLAEESGFILELGHWVLVQACQQLARWRQDPRLAELSIAINVSAQQFSHPQFITDVQTCLRNTGADPARLKLELTESMLASDVEALIHKMATLREQGVQFSLDDFGTGYSSLSYLKRLPLDQLKVDQSFVRDIMTDANDAAIVKAIINLGQSLSLPVIAEGVETAQQHDFLRDHGCAMFQGYFFSRPLNPQQLADYLQSTVLAAP